MTISRIIRACKGHEPVSLFVCLLIVGAGNASCAALQAPPSEIVISAGSTLYARNSEGRFSISASSPTRRTFRWRNREASVDLWKRGGRRWYGTLGLYAPQSDLKGTNWEENGIFVEAQMHFQSQATALAWLDSLVHHPVAPQHLVWNRSGLAVNLHEEFNASSDRETVLEAQIYQICIAGLKPIDFPGANDSAVRLVSAPGLAARTFPCTNPGPIDLTHS